MGIRFQCPNGHKLNVKSDLAGKRASCPECGAKLVIPAGGAEPDAAPAPKVAEPSSPANTVWFARTADGEQLGPALEPQFCDWISSGKVTADALVWRDGWDQWKLARDAADQLPVPLAAVAVPVPPPAAAPAAVAPQVEPSVAAPEPALDPAPAEAVRSEPIVTDAMAPAAKYVVQRRRSKKSQLVLAVVMLVTAIVLAGVLVWVVRSNSAPAPETSRLESTNPMIALAVVC